MPPPTRQLCALLHDGHVLTDDARRVPAYDADDRHTSLADRARTCGDPAAVLVAPQLQVGADPGELLSVFASRSGRRPGVWTAVADLAEDEPVVAALASVDAVAARRAEPPPRRPDWFSTTWYDDVEAWVDERLASLGRLRTGPSQPVKVWSLSAVLRVPCEPEPVWVKASCRHFHAEPALTRLVSEMLPGHTPRVVATDDERGWTLTEHIADADEDAEVEGIGPPAARVAAALQLRSLDFLPQIEAAGVPIRDLTATRRGFDEILASSVELDELTPDELAAVRATRARVHALLEELDSLGVPDTLVHGDLHRGNVAGHDEDLVLYDWSDASVSHPFLDLVVLAARLSDDEREATRAAYAAAWRAAYPAVDIARALDLAQHANTIYQLVTFEQIYRAQEDASYWELRGVVAQMLRSLPEALGRHSARPDPGDADHQGAGAVSPSLPGSAG